MSESQELPPLVEMVPVERTLHVHGPANLLMQYSSRRATDADLREVLKALPLDRLTAVLEPWLIKPTTTSIDDSPEGVVVRHTCLDDRAADLYRASRAGAKYAVAIFAAAVPATPKEGA